MAAAKSAKKAAVKKTSTKKQAPAKNVPAAKTAMTKSAILDEIAGNTRLTKKQVSSVFDELTVLIERHIKKGAIGQFTLPGLMKIEVKRNPDLHLRQNPPVDCYQGAQKPLHFSPLSFELVLCLHKHATS